MSPCACPRAPRHQTQPPAPPPPQPPLIYAMRGWPHAGPPRGSGFVPRRIPNGWRPSGRKGPSLAGDEVTFRCWAHKGLGPHPARWQLPLCPRFSSSRETPAPAPTMGGVGEGTRPPPPLCPCSSQLTVPAEGQTDHTPEAMLGPGLLWGLHPVGVSVSSCLGPQRRKASGGYGKGKRSQGRCSLSSAAETSVCLDPGLRVPACACLCGGDGPGGLGQASCPPACLWATVCESGSGTHFVLG